MDFVQGSAKVVRTDHVTAAMGRRAGCRTRCSYLHFWDVGERRRDLDGDFVSSPGAGTLEEEEGSYRKVDCACILQPFWPATLEEGEGSYRKMDSSAFLVTSSVFGCDSDCGDASCVVRESM